MIVDVAVGLFVLAVVAASVIAYRRREHLWERMISTMHGSRLYDFTRPKK